MPTVTTSCWQRRKRGGEGEGGGGCGGSVAPLLKSRGPHLAGGEITGNTEHVRDGHRLLEIVKKHM